MKLNFTMSYVVIRVDSPTIDSNNIATSSLLFMVYKLRDCFYIQFSKKYSCHFHRYQTIIQTGLCLRIISPFLLFLSVSL